MTQSEQKSVSFVNTIDWNGVSTSLEPIAGGMRWTWSGVGLHTITITHSDSTTQEITGDGQIVVTRYEGSVYDFYGA